MPSAEIVSYTVHVGRLGSLGSERLIVFQHRQPDAVGEPIMATSEVYFADRFGNTEIGFAIMGAIDHMRGHLPASDFEPWLDLVRHEDPVYLHWTIAEEMGQPDPHGIVHLATGPEPTGEGPRDLSP